MDFVFLCDKKYFVFGFFCMSFKLKYLWSLLLAKLCLFFCSHFCPYLQISEICDELGSLGKWLICCIGRGRGRAGNYRYNGSGSPENGTHSNGIHGGGSSDCYYGGYSTASFSGVDDPRRLSRASISSSLPSSGRNSVAIHSPSAFSTRSCSCNAPSCGNSISASGGGSRRMHTSSLSTMLPPPTSPLLGSPQHKSSFSLSPLPLRSHSLSGAAGGGGSGGGSGGASVTSTGTGSSGTPRAAFRACIERQKVSSAVEQITEEGESSTAGVEGGASERIPTSTLATELAVLACEGKEKKNARKSFEAAHPRQNNKCQLRVVNNNNGSRGRTVSLTPNGTSNCTTLTNSNALPLDRLANCASKLTNLRTLEGCKVPERVIKHRSGILSIVTRLVRHRPKQGPKKLGKAAKKQNGGTGSCGDEDAPNWPDVASIWERKKCQK